MSFFNIKCKELVTDQMVLTVGYDIENLTDSAVKNRYSGEVTTDHYGRSDCPTRRR